MTLLAMVTCIYLPMKSLAEYFNLQALPLSYFPYLIAILTGSQVLMTAMMRFCICKID